MLTKEQRQNVENLIEVLENHKGLFDINTCTKCALAIYENYFFDGDHEGLFEYESCKEHFGMDESTSENMFNLMYSLDEDRSKETQIQILKDYLKNNSSK